MAWLKTIVQSLHAPCLARESEAVAVALRGGAVVPRPSSGGAQRSGPIGGLTPREAEVLRLVAAGLTDREVAERLLVTPRTVNSHLTSIYGKLGVTSRSGAVRFAVEQGLT